VATSQQPNGLGQLCLVHALSMVTPYLSLPPPLPAHTLPVQLAARASSYPRTAIGALSQGRHTNRTSTLGTNASAEYSTCSRSNHLPAESIASESVLHDVTPASSMAARTARMSNLIWL
jgi:hypothetical protein